MEPRRMSNIPETEQVIARFRHWLDEIRSEVDTLDVHASVNEAPAEPVGFYQVVERLTTLRHEVKLLTKAARGGEERNEATLLSMQAAIEQFHSVSADESQAADRAARPLVEGLADLDESLRRGRLAIETARTRMIQKTGQHLREARERFEQLYRLQPWWRRVLCRPWHAAALEIHSDHAIDSPHDVFGSLLEGYDLIQARLRRTMDEHAIIRMQCVGRQVEPNSMTVVEVVRDPGLPPGQVIEEVRTGYYWKSKVFRFAEVKAVGER